MNSGCAAALDRLQDFCFMAVKAANKEPCPPPRSTLIFTPAFEVYTEFGMVSQASLDRVTSQEGKLLRVNRSIQAEGAFGQLKHNRGFVRFLTGGYVKVSTELYLLALSQNILKEISKRNSRKLDIHLFHPENVA